jgi:HSP20 family protein
MVAIIRRDPSRALTLVEHYFRSMSLLDEVERLAREMWNGWLPVTFHTTFAPRLEMYEDKEGLVVKAELPGIQKEDLSINLEGDMLRIEAEKKREETTEDARYHTYERYYGHYSRSVALPAPVEAEKVTATLEKGLLEIKLPKAEEAKPRQIEVKLESPKPKRTRTRKTKSK